MHFFLQYYTTFQTSTSAHHLPVRTVECVWMGSMDSLAPVLLDTLMTSVKQVSNRIFKFVPRDIRSELFNMIYALAGIG